MTLRLKTLVTIVATLVGLFALLLVAYHTTVLSSFADLEQQTTRTTVNQLTTYVDAQVRNLSLQLRDWSVWDETYAFVSGEGPDYPDNNLGDSTFENLRLNLMVFVDAAGRIVYSEAYDLARRDEMALVADLQALLDANPRLLAHGDTVGSHVSGLMVINSTALMVASGPVLKNDGSGPPAGTLIWARFLDEPTLAQLSDFVRASVSLLLLNTDDIPDEITALGLTVDQPVATRVIDSATVAGYGMLTGLYGAPAFVLKAVTDRAIYAHGQLSMSWFAGSLVAAGLIFGAVFLLLVERLVLSRLAAMSRAVDAISANGDLNARLDVRGSDELAKLAAAINSGFAATAESQAKLQALNERLERRIAERTGDVERELLFQEAILDSMNEGVLFGTEAEIEYANRMMSELTGYEPHEFIGQPPSRLFSGPSRQERLSLFGDTSSEGWLQRGERKLLRKDGRLLDVAYTVAPLLADPAGPKQITIVRDVTEEKALQARRDRFLANASHELRTPLTNLITRLYLLRRQPDQFETHLDILDKVAAHMKSLVEDLLDVSRFNRGTLVLNREALALAPIIREVVEMQGREAERKHLTMTTTLPDEDIVIYADRKRFVQVLTNLIFNAINYTPTGGSVDVRLATDRVDGSAFALLQIADTGIGIESENLDQIFQPFFRASQEVAGTGLGLAIVKEIVMRHGGEISVESSVGAGTTFTVRIAMLTEETETSGSALP